MKQTLSKPDAEAHLWPMIKGKDPHAACLVRHMNSGRGHKLTIIISGRVPEQRTYEASNWRCPGPRSLPTFPATSECFYDSVSIRCQNSYRFHGKGDGGARYISPVNFLSTLISPKDCGRRASEPGTTQPVFIVRRPPL